MAYRQGDKVRFLNEVGGGTISRIIDSRTVAVVDDDGFEIPVPVSEIIVAGQENYREIHDNPTVKSPVPEKQESPAVQQFHENIEGDNYELLLAFVPVKPSNIDSSDFDLYFVNDSPFYCMYVVSRHAEAGKFRLLDRQDLDPEMKKHLVRISQSETNIELSITCLLYKHINYRLYAPEQVKIALNPMKFMRNSSFVENDFFEEKAYLIKIASNAVPDLQISIDPQELEKAMKQKKEVKPIVPQMKQNSEVEEIDLHIEQLTDDIQGLDNGQMLEMQIARFTIALELGIAANTQKMIFIHGVGNGKLKHEIRRLLDSKYVKQVRYQDASFREYGYGATMVTIS